MKITAFRPEIKAAATGSIICLAFAAYTQHAWEDYWITFRSSLNLATGHGLVYTEGERLHTFTLPLGVLLPAGLSWITGNQSDNLTLWLFRIASIAMFGAAMGLLHVVLRRSLTGRAGIWLALAVIGLDSKIIDFTINGMETGLLIFFLALSLQGLLVDGKHQLIRMGAGFGGLMWTRPDSCVYIAALGLGSLLFLPGGKGRLRWTPRVKKLSAAGAVCAVLYLPWFLWAWNYYGSPVPHTIVAKSTNAPPLLFSQLLMELVFFPVLIVFGKTSVQWVFLPTYANWWFTDAYNCLVYASLLLGIIASLAWLLPVIRPQARLFSLAFYLGNFFLSAVVKVYYPWYLPILTVLGCLALGIIFDQALVWAKTLPQSSRAQWRLQKMLMVGAVLLVAAQVVITLFEARLMRVEQEVINNNLRREIGLWLRQHARTPHDTVMLESLGYVGFFSRLKMLDSPGLASREMVEARRRLGPAKENQAYLELKPDWLVLRPAEVASNNLIDPTRLKEFYDLVQIFDGTVKLKSARCLPVKTPLIGDSAFLVYHRKQE